MLRYSILVFLLFISCSKSDPKKTSENKEPSVYLSAISSEISESSFDPATLMWYTKPAAQWEDALPVGNGRLGAMVFGNVDEERIQLNEDTYWSGGPYSTVVKGGHEHLSEIQQLLFEGKPIQAHKKFGRYLMGYPVEQQKYQSLANLHLFFEKDQQMENYHRWLDLSTGITGVEYTVDGVRYLREVFVSAIDQVITIRITASEKAKISFDAELRGVRNGAHSNYATDYFRMDGDGLNELVLTGKSADYMGVKGKIRYEARAQFNTDGGTIHRNDARIQVQDANSVTIHIAAATNFVNYKDVSGDEQKRVQDYFNGISEKSYSFIRENSIADYQEFFNRVQLDLEATKSSFLPTDERLNGLESAPDPSLASLVYQFGRYLLISSSRPGTQPTNLQGIWNKDMNPSWDSKYTTNINTEMNYWAAESANLSELTEPLFTMIEELTDQGAQVAKEHYGAKGWVFHQNTDLWRVAAPMDGPTWGTFTVGGAWLTTHLWEHYLYNQDLNFLKKIYPVLKGSVDFFMDFLVEHPNGKWLVTNPSNSPENPPEGPGYAYFFDEVTGMYYFTTIVAGATMDMQLLKDLFKYYYEASENLDLDAAYREQVSNFRDRLVPSQIGSDGTLQEWTEDYGQMEDKHRHFSHLYGLYPGNVLSAKRTPEFVSGIKAVLEQRGDGGTGFSRAWKMALWARLYDGERANAIFKGYIKDQCYMSLFAKCFTPLQVDGSLGQTAAISEMLIQSHEGNLDFLPALPKEWSNGRLSGIKARGAFVIDMTWENNEIKTLEILSLAGKPCKIESNKLLKILENGKEIPVHSEEGIVEFSTRKNQKYQVIY